MRCFVSSQGLFAPWIWYCHPQAPGSAAYQRHCRWASTHTYMHAYPPPSPFLNVVFFSFFSLSCGCSTTITNLICCSFPSFQNGLNSSTAKGRSSPTSMRCAKRSRRRRIVSPGPTKAYRPSPSTCGFTPLTVRSHNSLSILSVNTSEWKEMVVNKEHI